MDNPVTIWENGYDPFFSFEYCSMDIWGSAIGMGDQLSINICNVLIEIFIKFNYAGLFRLSSPCYGVRKEKIIDAAYLFV
ncbi:hypothetical protein [Sphingobacterium psychroaquaticum]|uniref:hypothetical protein n=1 Tax=Sphingobacterium psychroaquaticum TaxID=561061 RepID=UPI001F1EBA04|nr:hypothetical protein [Sphingobacterium psychroaquaticum]